MGTRTKELCWAALLVAVGILLPQVFHMIGGKTAGAVFLPMHLPVLAAGFLLGPAWGAAVAAVTPLLSFLATAMPGAALLPFMLIELLAYGVISGLLRNRMNVYAALVSTQIAGRLVYALALFVAGTLLHLTNMGPVSVWTAVVTGLPGIAVQLFLLPVIVLSVKKAVSRPRG